MSRLIRYRVAALVLGGLLLGAPLLINGTATAGQVFRRCSTAVEPEARCAHPHRRFALLIRVTPDVPAPTVTPAVTPPGVVTPTAHAATVRPRPTVRPTRVRPTHVRPTRHPAVRTRPSHVRSTRHWTKHKSHSRTGVRDTHKIRTRPLRGTATRAPAITALPSRGSAAHVPSGGSGPAVPSGGSSATQSAALFPAVPQTVESSAAEGAPAAVSGTPAQVARGAEGVAMRPVEQSRPSGLLALIAIVCVIGVAVGAIRAFVSERASRTTIA